MSDSHASWMEEARAHLIRYAGTFSPLLAVKAEGSFFYTSDGRKILDFTSGQMCSIFGHNHPGLLEALSKAGDGPLHLLSTILSPAVIELAEKLAELLPPGLSKCMFVNTGSESNEVALRMAKLATGGYEVIGFLGSWHGMTSGSQAATYSHTRRGYGPVIPGSFALPAPYAYRCPIAHCKDSCDHTCLRSGFDMIDRQSTGNYAAMIAEPVLSAAGIIPLSAAYLEELEAQCKRRGIYLILDEAQTAFGRLGRNFGFELSSMTPDFLTLSKTLGGGLPLAATITSEAIEEKCHQAGFIYITSHVSDPLPASVGLKMLHILQQEKMAEKASEQGNYLLNQLHTLQSRHECIGDIRGEGLLLGVEIVKDRERRTPAPELGYRISERCLELGLSMNIVRLPGMSGTFRIAPPLNVSRDEIDLGISMLDQAISEVTGETAEL